VHPVIAQTRLPTRTVIISPTTITGPAKLVAYSDLVREGRVSLTWTPVNGASGYRVNRVNNSGEAERTIYEGSRTDFMYTTGTFTPTWGEVYCDAALAQDVWFCRYKDVGLTNGVLYSYRVYALFQNGVVSPGSPVASVVAGSNTYSR
jgi:hypothetical protein